MRREHLDFLVQIKGIGRNLNQLTRKANSTGTGKFNGRHEVILTDIETILKQIRDDR